MHCLPVKILPAGRLFLLDLPESAYQALKEHTGAHAIVPGNPEISSLYLSITAKDSAQLMPPPSSNLKLTRHEIALLERWIKQGAKYEKHWAFTPIKKAALPGVDNETWCKNEIDRFVLSKLEQQDLKPNLETDKERLLKRVSLDLTGLPPTLAQMDAFLADQRPEAYEIMVDQFLQQPAYGEKMALHWLDLARYADSHGYQDDGYRTQWPWRDWVIHAYYKNMPYNEFVTWQLAGDLLPGAGKEQLLATAFNRNHKITEEGGVIQEEYRTMYVSDRTDLVGKGLVKTTGDFGMQGELPSHPALLHWLAYDFIQHNWNIKRLVKMMVTYATYRQSGGISPDKPARGSGKYIDGKRSALSHCSRTDQGPGSKQQRPPEQEYRRTQR